MSNIFALLISFFSFSVFSQVNCEQYKTVSFKELPYEILHYYRQTSPQLVDGESDFALLKMIRSNPKNPLNFETNSSRLISSGYENCAEILFGYKKLEKHVIVETKTDDYYYKETRVAPFSSMKMANMFNRVIQEEAALGIKPSVGQFHQWEKKHFPYTVVSKTLWSLSRGETSRFMITGLEDNLRKWIVSQENESISLDKMFRQAYRLNLGNIYMTLLTVENVLSQDWQNPERANFVITRKLKKFTNTIGNDDRFGHWYHLFGIMLYGYVKNSVNAHFVGSMESLSSVVMKQQHEHQEKMINTRGGKVGALLKKWIKKGSWDKRETEVNFLDENYYLD